MKCYIKDYPRPQFVRREWQNLNGEWNFIFDNNDEGETKKYFKEIPMDKKIIVPFTYETKLSGIGDESVHYIVWYNRKILNMEDIDYLLMDEKRNYKIEPSIIRNINNMK